jgi:hypothetical protein
MIDPESAFAIAGLAALAGWAALLAALFVGPARRAALIAAQFVIPALLAAGYVLLMWQGRAAFDVGGFGSIGEVRALFAHDSTLAAGWLHYLAFDLFIGAWIVRDAGTRGVFAPIVLPCLPLTFLFGPAGLLLYLTVRLVLRRTKTEIEP